MKKKKEKKYQKRKNIEILDVKKIRYIEIDLFRDGVYEVTENYWPEILKKVYWKGGFFVVESTTETHIYSSVMAGKIEIFFKKIKIDHSKEPGEIEFTGTMPSKRAGRVPIPREDPLPKFTQLDDVQDNNIKNEGSD